MGPMRPQDRDILILEINDWVRDQTTSILLALRQCHGFREQFLSDCNKTIGELDYKYALTDCFQDFTRTANNWCEVSDIEWRRWRQRALKAVKCRLRNLYKKEFKARRKGEVV